MARIPTYKDYYSEGLFDDEWEEDAEEQDDYERKMRCGLDDPLPMKDVDLSTRLDLLHVMMLAYDVRPEELINFINILYGKDKKNEDIEKLEKLRGKYRK